MRADRKVIEGRLGYNVFLGVKWGHFTVTDLNYTLRLDYDKGGIVDYLKVHPENNDIMLGKFYNKTPTGEAYKAIFTLARI